MNNTSRDQGEMLRDAQDIAEESRSFNNEESPDCLECTRAANNMHCYDICAVEIGYEPVTQSINSEYGYKQTIDSLNTRITRALKIAASHGFQKYDNPADDVDNKGDTIKNIIQALAGDNAEAVLGSIDNY